MISAGEAVPAAGERAAVGVEGDSVRRRNLVQLGLWIFLATVTMLFAAFSSAYLVRQAGEDWRPIALPSVLWLNTALLIASGAALEVGRAQVRRARWGAVRGAFLVAILLGVAFLAGQLVAWQRLTALGVYVPTSPHSSFFYILTGLHGLHLIAGLALLLYAFVRLAGADGGGVRLDRRGLVDLSVTFWRFFGFLWLYLFFMLSVV